MTDLAAALAILTETPFLAWGKEHIAEDEDGRVDIDCRGLTNTAIERLGTITDELLAVTAPLHLMLLANESALAPLLESQEQSSIHAIAAIRTTLQTLTFADTEEAKR